MKKMLLTGLVAGLTSCATMRETSNSIEKGLDTARKFTIGYIDPQTSYETNITNNSMLTTFKEEHNGTKYSCSTDGTWGFFNNPEPKLVEIYRKNKPVQLFENGKVLDKCKSNVNEVIKEVESYISQLNTMIDNGNIEYGKTTKGVIDYNTIVGFSGRTTIETSVTNSFLSGKKTTRFVVKKDEKPFIIVEGTPEFLKEKMENLAQRGIQKLGLEEMF